MAGYDFTSRVRGSLIKARQDAQRRNHDYVGTEHLLLGLLAEEDALVMDVLENLSANPMVLQQAVEQRVTDGQPGRRVITNTDLPYTSRARVVRDQAIATAHEFGDGYVGTQHLLLGLIRETHGIAAQSLTAAGLTEPKLKREVVRILQGEGVAATLEDMASEPAWMQVPLSTAAEVRSEDGTWAREVFASKDAESGCLGERSGGERGVAGARGLAGLDRERGGLAGIGELLGGLLAGEMTHRQAQTLGDDAELDRGGGGPVVFHLADEALGRHAFGQLALGQTPSESCFTEPIADRVHFASQCIALLNRPPKSILTPNSTGCYIPAERHGAPGLKGDVPCPVSPPLSPPPPPSSSPSVPRLPDDPPAAFPASCAARAAPPLPFCCSSVSWRFCQGLRRYGTDQGVLLGGWRNRSDRSARPDRPIRVGPSPPICLDVPQIHLRQE